MGSLQKSIKVHGIFNGSQKRRVTSTSNADIFLQE